MSVAVSFNGVNISFPAPDADWNMSIGHSHICRPCRAALPEGGGGVGGEGPFNLEPIPGSLGGNGLPGSCCLSWNTSCYMDGGVYTCSPTNVCGVSC